MISNFLLDINKNMKYSILNKATNTHILCGCPSVLPI